MLRIGIDIGGTFTDFVVFDPNSGNIATYKLLTDPRHRASTVLQGLRGVLSAQPAQIIHGSTVATNALLERKGARTGLVTTGGFKDVLQIGRQNRPSLYDWNVKPVPPLVPSEYRFEVNERVDYQGNVLVPLDPAQVSGLIDRFKTGGIESVAVCLLFSFLYPDHERQISDHLRQAGFSVSASSEILPEFREYERSSTTVVNAYVSPIMDRYLSVLEKALPESSLQIMQSNGGMISVAEARHNAVRCILSGPAGGIVGAQYIAQLIDDGYKSNPTSQAVKLITFDMGGTSTDVSLIDGQPSLTTEASVGGCPIHLPVLDIHTIGAGGGSIAYVDAGGSLRVGPQSAGAEPGPACYGKGDLPTVTDANLVLSRLLPDRFLDGKMPIYPERAFKAISSLAINLGMDVLRAAKGVIEVVNAQMERALRVISVERGHDPRDFSLFAFGGAGGLHACELARRVGIPKVIISKYASTLSAFGMLATNVVKDYVRTVMLPATVDRSKLNALTAPMIHQGECEIQAEGFDPKEVEIHLSVDARYTGQSYELNIPFTQELLTNFHQAHQLTYGYNYPDKPVEIVNIRLRVAGKVEPVSLPHSGLNTSDFHPLPSEFRQVELAAGPENVPVYEYEHVYPGSRITGPALFVSTDTTILIDVGDEVFVDMYQNLIVDICPEMV